MNTSRNYGRNATNTHAANIRLDIPYFDIWEREKYSTSTNYFAAQEAVKHRVDRCKCLGIICYWTYLCILTSEIRDAAIKMLNSVVVTHSYPNWQHDSSKDSGLDLNEETPVKNQNEKNIWNPLLLGQQYTKVPSLCINFGWLNFKQTKTTKTKAKSRKGNQTDL